MTDTTRGSLDGQVVVVTGAGGGLGRAYALEVARHGARVLVNDLGGGAHGEQPGAGEGGAAAEVAALIRDAGGEAVADASDITTDATGVVAAAVEAFGRIDAVINNAGISGGGWIDEIPIEKFRRMIDVHFWGTVEMTRAAWPLMKAQGSGRIVNTSSNSVLGLPFSSHYIAAKAAIFGLTRATAKDGAAHGIKVNAVMPTAYTRLTAQIPDDALRSMLEKAYKPEFVAPFVATLVHEEVPCTGETFCVSAGRASRVFLGVAPGYGAPEAEAATPADFLANFDKVMQTEGHLLATDTMQEVAFTANLLGLDAGTPTIGN